MKTITITLSAEQVAQLDLIRSTRLGRSEADIIDQVVERGIYDLTYRTKYNAKKYAADKEVREEFKKFKASLK
jgi:predicted DNA-binding protein